MNRSNASSLRPNASSNASSPSPSRCPQCNNKVLQKSDGGETRLRIEGPITVSSDGTVRGRCYWCKSALELPLSLRREPALVVRT